MELAIKKSKWILKILVLIKSKIDIPKMIKINNRTQITSFTVQDCNNVYEFKSEKLLELKDKSLLSLFSKKRILINFNKAPNILRLVIFQKHPEKDLKKFFVKNSVFKL